MKKEAANKQKKIGRIKKTLIDPSEIAKPKIHINSEGQNN